MRREFWSMPSTLSSYIKTPLPTLCFTFFFRVTAGPPFLCLSHCFWSWGTYLLLLTELQPCMLQHMLITHGVALEVAVFPCHHITPQRKEAGLQVVFPESDLKRKGHHSQLLQQGSLTMPGLMVQAALAHRATSLSPPLKSVSSSLSFRSALNMHKTRDTNTSGGPHTICLSILNI